VKCFECLWISVWQLASREECVKHIFRHFEDVPIMTRQDRNSRAPHERQQQVKLNQTSIGREKCAADTEKKCFLSLAARFIFELYDNLFETTTSHPCGNQKLSAHSRKFNQFY
jgi:hypothetical protein